MRDLKIQNFVQRLVLAKSQNTPGLVWFCCLDSREQVEQFCILCTMKCGRDVFAHPTTARDLPTGALRSLELVEQAPSTEAINHLQDLGRKCVLLEALL